MIQDDMQKVMDALSDIRLNPVAVEYDLQTEIAWRLTAAGISFKKEFQLGPRNRVDFLTETEIAIEVKKSKPDRGRLLEQIERYAGFDAVAAVLVVVETSILHQLPNEVNGKQCSLLELSRLWGIAL
jgi:hypothetical protein